MSEDLIMFDRDTHVLKRNRAALHFPNDNAIIYNAANNLISRLDELKVDFSSILVIGYNSVVAKLLKKFLNVKLVVQTDIAEKMIKKAITEDALEDKQSLKIIADEEWLPFSEKSFDVIIDFFTLHWINDLPGALLQIKRTLKPNGFFFASFFGGETLMELKQSIAEAEKKIESKITKRVSPFVDIRQAGSLLQRAGFSNPVVDKDNFAIKFHSVNDLMQTIRRIGETNTLNKRKTTFTRKETFYELEKIYKKNFMSNDNQINATIEILNITAW